MRTKGVVYSINGSFSIKFKRSTKFNRHLRVTSYIYMYKVSHAGHFKDSIMLSSTVQFGVMMRECRDDECCIRSDAMGLKNFLTA